MSFQLEMNRIRNNISELGAHIGSSQNPKDIKKLWIEISLIKLRLVLIFYEREYPVIGIAPLRRLRCWWKYKIARTGFHQWTHGNVKNWKGNKITYRQYCAACGKQNKTSICLAGNYLDHYHV